MTGQMWSDGIRDGYETRPCCSYSVRNHEANHHLVIIIKVH